MPCSYCSLVGASPTAAKWPFIVITEGAVALEAADGRRGELVMPLLGGDVDIARRRKPSIVPAIERARSVGDNYYSQCRLKQIRANSSTA